MPEELGQSGQAEDDFWKRLNPLSRKLRAMSLRRSLLSTFIGPSLCCGVAGGVGAYWWTQSSVAAACVLAACAVGAAVSFTVAALQSRRAVAQLRSLEFRTGKTHTAGIYADLLETAQSLIADLRQKADESSQARTKMEARNHMRKKQALQFERALACIEQPVMITDGRGRVLYGNPAVCALFRRIPSDSGERKEERENDLEREKVFSN